MPEKITYIDGSPRMSNCLSATLISEMSEKIGHSIKKQEVIKVIKDYQQNKVDINVSKAFESEVLVFVTPLYYDALPSHLLYFMECMAEYRKNHKEIKSQMVYMCINSGFLDSLQSKNAIEIVKNFTKKIQFQWGGAISIGGGELFKLHKTSKSQNSKLLKPVFDGIEQFTVAVSKKKVIEGASNTILVHEDMSQGFFRIYANIGQIFIARANAIKFKRLWEKDSNLK